MVQTVPSLIHVLLKRAKLILMFMYFSSFFIKQNKTIKAQTQTKNQTPQSWTTDVKLTGYIEINKEF